MRTSIVIAALFAASAAGATTYTVTTTADSGAGSLRQAILDANGSPGADTINFNIVGSGIHTIAPATPLPNLSEAVTINGYSQPGASANTNAPNQGSNAVILIEIDGHNLGFGQNDFTLTAAATIRGLAINRALNAGIQCAAGSSSSIIAGNFIGTDPTGSSLPGPQSYGVEISGASGVTVGGTTPADRNVIAGNGGANILMGDAPAPNTVIKGNLIGVNAAGTAALAAGSPYGGIYDRVGTGIVVGGPTPAERNVISGHPQSGVVIGYTVGGTAAQGTIEGNFIGTDVTGTLPIPNHTGVFLPNSNCIVRDNVIAANIHLRNLCRWRRQPGDPGQLHRHGRHGDAEPRQRRRRRHHRREQLDDRRQGAGEGNVIAHNGAPYGGIVNGGYQTARIRRNRIFDNETLGIDLTPVGVTPNDAGDGDTGPNGAAELPHPDLGRSGARRRHGHAHHRRAEQHGRRRPSTSTSFPIPPAPPGRRNTSKARTISAPRRSRRMDRATPRSTSFCRRRSRTARGSQRRPRTPRATPRSSRSG